MLLALPNLIAKLPTVGTEAGWTPNGCKCDGRIPSDRNSHEVDSVRLLCDDPALRKDARADWEALYSFHTPNPRRAELRKILGSI